LAANPAQFTTKRLIGIMGAVTAIVAVLMVSLGLSGYLTFFNNTNGNVLTNYSIDDPLIGVCRALVTVIVVCSYPLFNMPLRESLFYLFGQFKQYRANKSLGTAHVMSAEPMEDLSKKGIISEDNSTSAWHSDDTAQTHSASSDELNQGYETGDTIKLDLDAIIGLQSGEDAIPENRDLETSTPPSQPESSTKAANISGDFVKESPYAVWMRSAIQTAVAWALAFSLAYVIPDITIVIGFVGSTFSPIYYFALPALVALSLPEGKKSTRIGAYFLFACCAYFLIAGFAAYALPKNKVTPPLPSFQNQTAPV
jgi:hypothetical protein